MYNFSAKLEFSPAMDFQLSLQYQLGEFRSKLWRILTKKKLSTELQFLHPIISTGNLLSGNTR